MFHAVAPCAWQDIQEVNPILGEKWSGRLDEIKKWTKDLTSVGESITEKEPEKFFSVVKDRFKELTVAETMYLYLVDELTGKPLRAKGYPIEITKRSEVVPKMLPFISQGMKAMSLYNGVAGIINMFGIPFPRVPKSVRENMKESVEMLNRKSSVEAFSVLHGKVEEGDDESKTVRGACLRELERFFEKHNSNKT